MQRLTTYPIIALTIILTGLLHADTTIQAEDGELDSGARILSSPKTDFGGTGYVMLSSPPQAVTLTDLQANGASSGVVTIRYAHQEELFTIHVAINGTDRELTLLPPEPTAEWTRISFVASLQSATENQIHITPVTAGKMLIDELQLSPIQVTGHTLPLAKGTLASGAKIITSDRPVEQHLALSTKGDSWELADVDGGSGGWRTLLIHYAASTPATCMLTVNEGEPIPVTFIPAQNAEPQEIALPMLKGKQNKIRLTLTEGSVVITHIENPSGAAVTTFTDIAYQVSGNAATLQKGKLDIFLPPTLAPRPIFLFLHGGGLVNGNKRGYTGFCRHLAARGYVVVNANYRLKKMAGVAAPAYMEDVARAIRWIRQNSTHVMGDNRRIYVTGHSAGGYLAAIVCLDKRYLNAVDSSLTDIAACLPISGQMQTHNTIRKELSLGPESEYAPLWYAGQSGQPFPPFFICAADSDIKGRVDQNIQMKERLQQSGYKAEYQTMPNRNHTTIVKKAGSADDQILDAFVRFVHNLEINTPNNQSP